MDAVTCLRFSGLVFAAAILASAQPRVEPGRVAEVARAFESARSAPRLQCDMRGTPPALGYGLTYRAGYLLDLPLHQFSPGPHPVHVFLRVTLQGGPPAYFDQVSAVRALPARRTDARLSGSFDLGEGSYEVTGLARDESGRACLANWKTQVKPDAAERELRNLEAAKGRLTILVHAAAPDPRMERMTPQMIRSLTESLGSLLAQLHAPSVRLVVFNLARQAVLLEKDPFRSQDLEQVTRAFDQLPTAGGNDDVLSVLVERELKSPDPPAAVILMGPRVASPVEVSLEASLPRAAPVPWFYLQYGPPVRVSMQSMGWQSMPQRSGGIDPLPPPPDAPSSPASDGIEHLVHRLNGVTLAVRSPHEFAAAVARIGKAIPITADSGTTDVVSAGKPVYAATTSAEAADPVDVLVRLRDHVIARGAVVPRHTCVETVQRERFEPRAGRAVHACDTLLAARSQGDDHLRLDLTDWLRLDVAVADGREVFSWAGAPRFDDRDIDQLIPDGAFGSGPFASLLFSVFAGRAAHFVFAGATTFNGRAALEYSFRVPRESSQYRVKTANADWVVTGYTGTLTADAHTADLMRFVVRTEELPVSTGACETDTTIDYSRAPAGSFEYLLPQVTRQRFIGRDGGENENTVSFSACREFRGESSVTFGNPPANARSTVTPVPARVLPAGLLLKVELKSALIFGEAAAGDRIEGRLLEPLQDPATKQVIAPAGSTVSGRLTRMELRHVGNGTYTIGLRWQTLETPAGSILLNLKPQRSFAGLKAAARGALQRGMEIDLPPAGEENDAFYHFPGTLPRMNFPLHSEWVTTSPP